MSCLSRRKFFSATGSSLAATALVQPPLKGSLDPFVAPLAASIDFRYSPLSWQTAYCFPDDPYKSLVGERGELRYGHPGRGKAIDYFPTVVEFSLAGMEADRVISQRLESPGIPIVYTQIERPTVTLQLITFATNRKDEGRVDNVVVAVRPKTKSPIHHQILVRITTRTDLSVRPSGFAGLVHKNDRLFMAASIPLSARDTGAGYVLASPDAVAYAAQPALGFFRFPQEGQDFERIAAGLQQPYLLLSETRTFWQNWSPFGGDINWRLPEKLHEFLIASARNILQARELTDGKLTFKVGPTVYRGLWVVDGHFILEAARYLGYDVEAQQGLETIWSTQEAGGGIFAGGGQEHWKDTGIAMFSLVRQAELGQNWDYFLKMRPHVLRAVEFLRSLRARAQQEGSANGRYGLLAQGFGDGGLSGIRSEFTNTLWVLAGLRATVGAARKLGLSEFEQTRSFFEELRGAFFTAARQEMRKHPAGFSYLPMLMAEDPQWKAAEEWNKPRPQSGQWALSHAIYPGLLFEKDDPVVTGHIRLMQACTQEDVPAETGWIHHGGLWTYNAPFVAHVYLWAGLKDWARPAFTGFLNHASPLYCWREEQPLRGSLTAGYVGDMPHNWASAECILYLRHMLAFEDGNSLRLLEGISEQELAANQPLVLAHSPTRFGRLDLTVEPEDEGRRWRLHFQRGKGPLPSSVTVPERLGSYLRFEKSGAAVIGRQGNSIQISPEKNDFSITWTRK